MKKEEFSQILNKSVLIIFLAVALSFVYFSCSENVSPLPSVSHTPSWSNPQSEDFHGTKVINNGYSSCTSCHGQDYMGGDSKVSCYDCHETFPHPKEWKVITDDLFHGTYISNNHWNMNDCKKCHGQDYSGGSSGISCYDCHKGIPHPVNWMSSHSEDFHGNAIRQDNWSMTFCKTCHGQDYKGGKTGSSCYNCHTKEGGPEACNICHGNRDHNFPPEDLNKNNETTSLGVGAHEIHMNSFNNCALCHIVPTSFDDPNHIDSPPVEVNSTWGWDRNSATCSLACHADPNKDYIWNNF